MVYLNNNMLGIVRPLRLEHLVNGVGLRTGIHSVNPHKKKKKAKNFCLIAGRGTPTRVLRNGRTAAESPIS